MASRAAVEAALARMEAARYSKSEYRPIKWRWWYSSREGQCQTCGVKRGLMVYKVTPHRSEPMTRPDGTVYRPAERFSWIARRCLDTTVCEARAAKKQEARSRRSGSIAWRCSRFQHAESGCRWCGEPIEFIESVGGRHAARETHRGDDVEIGDRDCRREYERSWVYQPRFLIIYRGDPCCVDCGDTGHDWEADHDLALEDGGTHDACNIVRRCTPCHKAKTKAENRARAECRRVDKAQAAA